jgi:hypothetical protein
MFINHLFKCVFCNKENKIDIEEEDRGQLQMKKGDEIEFTCNYCHKKGKVHINNIYAEPSKYGYLSGIIISLIIPIIFWNLGNAILLIFGLPMGIYLYQQSLARNFNNYKIRK